MGGEIINSLNSFMSKLYSSRKYSQTVKFEEEFASV